MENDEPDDWPTEYDQYVTDLLLAPDSDPNLCMIRTKWQGTEVTVLAHWSGDAVGEGDGRMVTVPLVMVLPSSLGDLMPEPVSFESDNDIVFLTRAEDPADRMKELSDRSARMSDEELEELEELDDLDVEEQRIAKKAVNRATAEKAAKKATSAAKSAKRAANKTGGGTPIARRKA